MKKILIISYFFPPCNLTASQRIMGWANYLSNFGYYPTVVTRNWDHPIISPEDASVSTGKEIIHEINENFEVYYLPFIANKRDEIFAKNKGNKYFQKLSKISTLKELIFENFSNSVIPSINLYEFSRNLFLKNEQFEGAIISAKPFIQFKFGYLLNKEFGVKWIADYRDDWNTSELESKLGLLKSILFKLQSKSEKKWLATASFITSISKLYAERIGEFVNKEGVVILNGFESEGIDNQIVLDSKSFTITYNGSLYETQPIEPILNALKKCIDNVDITLEIQINFPGLGFDKLQEKRVSEHMKGYEKYIHISDRIPKKEVITIQNNSDLLLMVSHEGFKGVPSSKMYEYIGLKKRVLVYPNDFDIVEETMNDLEIGIICSDEEDIYLKLLALIIEKQKLETSEFKFDQDKINFYSRKNQTKELAKLLDKLN